MLSRFEMTAGMVGQSMANAGTLSPVEVGGVAHALVGTLEQIVHGPSTVPDGSMNLMGALRRTMATAGYSDLKEFQRVEVVVSDSGLPGGRR